MNLSRYICIPSHAAIAHELDVPVVSTATHGGPPAEPKKDLSKAPRMRGPAWAKMLSWKKASPPIALEGGRWMNQYDEQRLVTFRRDMTAGLMESTLQLSSNMKIDKRKLIAKDIRTMLAIYSDDDPKAQKAADKYFRKTYAKVFNKESYSFEDKSLRNLMNDFCKLIDQQVVAEGPPTSLASVAGPGFNHEGTNLAYERIFNAFLHNYVREQTTVPNTTSFSYQSETVSAASLDTAASSASMSPSASAPTPDQERRGIARIRAELVAMQDGNDKFRQWLADNNIEAVSNTGVGLNCLIIALLQHATGAYGTEFEPRLSVLAQQFRQGLGISPGMLYSDDDTAGRILAAINAASNTDMVLMEVQADESGRPFLSRPAAGEQAGNKVAIWQRGNHFEALRAMDT